MFYKKVAHKILSKFTCNLVKKETPTQLYFCEYSEIIKKSRTPAMAGSGFRTVLPQHDRTTAKEHRYD